MEAPRGRLHKALKVIGFLVVGGLMVYYAYTQIGSKSAPAQSPNTYMVNKVIDGDTVELNVNGRNTTFRLIGMDTPEVVDPRKVVQCFGREASAKGHELMEGKSVRVETDPLVGELDKYNRHLAYIWLPDGTLYNKYMISEGFAHEYTYQSQHYKYQTEFKDAEKSAKADNKGFWAPNTCEGNTTQPAK